MQHHYVRELVADKELDIEWVCSADMLADGFTKALTVDNFRRHSSLTRNVYLETDDEVEADEGERKLTRLTNERVLERGSTLARA